MSTFKNKLKKFEERMCLLDDAMKQKDIAIRRRRLQIILTNPDSRKAFYKISEAHERAKKMGLDSDKAVNQWTQDDPELAEAAKIISNRLKEAFSGE